MSNLHEGQKIITAPVVPRLETQGAARVLMEIHPSIEDTSVSHLPQTETQLREIPVQQPRSEMWHLFSGTPKGNKESVRRGLCLCGCEPQDLQRITGTTVLGEKLL